MSSVAIIAGVAAVAGAGATMYSASQQRKAAAKAADAAGQGGGNVDITALQKQANDIATQNAYGSKALEAQLNPATARLRDLTSQQLLQDAMKNANDKTSGAVQQKVLDAINNPSQLPALQRSALFDAATNKALSDLNLGGGLDTATRNEVTRRSLGTSADVSGGGLGLGRDISARDLGLTSLGLQQQRLAAAMQQGGADANLNVGQQNAQAQQNQLNQANLASNAALYTTLGNTKQQQNLTLAEYIQSIQQPTVGLDPGSVADIAVGNSNQASNAAQQRAGILAQSGANQAGANASALGAGLGGLATIAGGVAKYNANSNPGGQFGMTPQQYNQFVNTPMGTTPQAIPAVQTDWSFPTQGLAVGNNAYK